MFDSQRFFDHQNYITVLSNSLQTTFIDRDRTRPNQRRSFIQKLHSLHFNFSFEFFFRNFSELRPSGLLRLHNHHPWRRPRLRLSGVNFINVKRANFLYECHFGSFFYVHVTKKKLPKQRSYKKFVCKMLMKLTTGVLQQNTSL